ncbi:MAG: TPM domain-containing protein [Ramlibacter sp.]
MLKLVVLLWALVAGSPGLAQDVLPVPALTARVVDQTGTLNDIQRTDLEQKLAALQAGKGTQLVILLVPTTAPEDISIYANRVANTWKIGRRQVGDGVLVIVAKNDRKVRIEVAKTLEGAIPDLAARQVIDDAITPKFRSGDFAGGLQAAADQLIARINGEALPAPPQRSWHDGDTRGGKGFDWFDLAIFLFFAVPVGGAVLRRVFGRPLGTLLTGGGVGALAFVLTSSLGLAVIAGIVALVVSLFSALGSDRRSAWGAVPFMDGLGGGGFGGGGGGSGGGGSGGFSSGGGGDFGGGGASGDW